MRLGVLGGTFDPPHLGHLIIAEEARTALKLDRVMFMPAGDPYQKSAEREVSAAIHRLSMVRLAITGNAAFERSSMETEQNGPSYTVETLRRLRSRLGTADGLWLILGTDSLAGLPGWKEPARLLELCRLAVAPRARDASDLDQLERQLPGLKAAVDWLEMGRVDISSTEIRRRVAAGKTIRYQVPAAVEEYIAAQGLYK
jgi:nicotinate-nucleotide adenylyltransferase